MSGAIRASGAGSITSHQSDQQIFINGIEFLAGLALIALFMDDDWDRNTRIAFMALVALLAVT